MTALPSLARAKWLKEPGLQRIFSVIKDAGGEARVAGGAVRNALLKVPVADIDLATTLAPQKVAVACEGAGLKVVPTGIEHGTLTVVMNHRPYEITTLRHDVETFGRKARVAFHDDWEADALRRDFTMNALYCDARGKIYDFTNGYQDILRKRIIFVGSPSQRIKEDYLRILRFFRFHARFGKGNPDSRGLAACVHYRKGLDGLSAERIRQELLKLIVAPGAVATLKLMAKSRILERIVPYREDWRTLGRLLGDAVLRLAVLASEPDGLKERLRLSNHQAERISQVLAAAPVTTALRPAERRAVLYRLGAEGFRDIVQLSWARSDSAPNDPSWRALLRLADKWPVPTMPVNGQHLLGKGIKPGPEIGKTLQRLEDWWIASDFKTGKDELLARLGK